MYTSNRYFGPKLNLFWFYANFFHFDKFESAYFKYAYFFKILPKNTQMRYFCSQISSFLV